MSSVPDPFAPPVVSDDRSPTKAPDVAARRHEPAWDAFEVWRTRVRDARRVQPPRPPRFRKAIP